MVVSIVATLRPLAPGLLAGAGAAAVLAALRTPARLRVLPAAGLAIAVGVYGSGMAAVVVLHVLAYGMARALAAVGGATPNRASRRWRLAQGSMAGLGVMALAGRALHATMWQLPDGGHSWAPVYLDMMMFARLEALLWEVGAGKVVRFPTRAFVAWCALPFGLFGPLLRFSEWLAQEEAGLASPTRAERRQVLKLLGLGLAQVAALVSLVAMSAALAPPPGLRPQLWRRALEWFAISPWTFYLGAAAYANLLISAAAYAGIRLPTTYDRPFGRPNLSAFWAHWNIPVTSLVRDMLFYRRWGLGRNDVYVSVMLVFVLIGLWHAGSPYWLVWGLLHGIGYSVYLAYARLLRAGDKTAAIIRAVVPGRLVTYLFVCCCWAFTPQVMRLVQALWQR